MTSNILGNRETVAHLVRTFLLTVAAIFEDVMDGIEKPEHENVGQKCIEMGQIFSGQNALYVTNPDWNGAPLARYLQDHTGMHADDTDETPSDTITSYFAEKSGEWVNCMVRNNLNEISDDETQKWVNRTLVQMTYDLMGEQPSGAAP
ncbi:hypothetical protein GMO_24230 [Gluconobacter morbifer G707]|uniref:Uncharacterized protein n=1 Tax=Gluconobacter morbifer G707 TaxID=1088869 RepID=G6XM23_9PROT|nr:hypothetical protein GMO_24230 [Gluconobacter morbifer G707]